MSRWLIEEALRRHGISDPVKLESHLLACELEHPIVEELLDNGTIIDVWVADGREPGKYAAPQGSQPEELAITPEGRHLESFRLIQPLRVVRCIAAPFPVGKVPGVGGTGGGTQFIMPPNWLMAVERVAHD
jgi:hypothetical protein